MPTRLAEKPDIVARHMPPLDGGDAGRCREAWDTVMVGRLELAAPTNGRRADRRRRARFRRLRRAHARDRVPPLRYRGPRPFGRPGGAWRAPRGSPRDR